MHPAVCNSSEHDFDLQTKLLKHRGSSELAFSQGLSSFYLPYMNGKQKKKRPPCVPPLQPRSLPSPFALHPRAPDAPSSAGASFGRGVVPVGAGVARGRSAGTYPSVCPRVLHAHQEPHVGLCPPRFQHQPTPWSWGCSKETAPISLRIAYPKGKSVEPNFTALRDTAPRLRFGTRALPKEVAPSAGQLRCHAALPGTAARGHVPVREPPAPRHTAGTRGQPGATGRARLTSPLAARHPLRGKGHHASRHGPWDGNRRGNAHTVLSSPAPASQTQAVQGCSWKRVPSAAQEGGLPPTASELPPATGGVLFLKP